MDGMFIRLRAVAIVGAAALLTVPAAGAAAHAAAPHGAHARSAASCPYADQTTANATVSELAAGVRCLINEQRNAAGRGSVAPNRRLTSAASRHATDMVSRHYFGHTSLGGTTLIDRIRRTGYLSRAGQWRAGEILAWASGTQGTPRGIVNAWMGSPEHRQILLDPGLTDVGVGLAFGSPRAADPTAITVDADFGTRS
jgi:uncharacterized protein YkwD